MRIDMLIHSVKRVWWAYSSSGIDQESAEHKRQIVAGIEAVPESAEHKHSERFAAR